MFNWYQLKYNDNYVILSLEKIYTIGLLTFLFVK